MVLRFHKKTSAVFLMMLSYKCKQNRNIFNIKPLGFNYS